MMQNEIFKKQCETPVWSLVSLSLSSRLNTPFMLGSWRNTEMVNRVSLIFRSADILRFRLAYLLDLAPIALFRCCRWHSSSWCRSRRVSQCVRRLQGEIIAVCQDLSWHQYQIGVKRESIANKQSKKLNGFTQFSLVFSLTRLQFTNTKKIMNVDL